MSKEKEERNSGLATAGMIIGIIAITGSWVPFLNIFSIILGVLAVIFGGVALLQKRSISKAVTALVLGVITIIVAVAIISAASQAIDKAIQSPKKDESSDQKKLPLQATYDKLKSGMTKEKVEAIIGKDTGTCSITENDLVGKIESCTYGSALNNLFDGGMIMISYQNDKLNTKTIGKF